MNVKRRLKGAMTTEDNTYLVGYGKPPVHTRFAKGRSGNPKGRPRGAKNMATLIEEALNERVTVKENGRTRRITKKAAAFKQAVNKAAAGDLKALRFVVEQMKEYETTPPREGEAPASSWRFDLNEKASCELWRNTLRGLFQAGLTPGELGIAPDMLLPESASDPSQAGRPYPGGLPEAGSATGGGAAEGESN